MRKKKLLKKSASDYSNLIMPGTGLEINKGQWNKIYTKNNPLWLEFGTGRGKYITEMAKLFPLKNFLGLDIKIDRLVKTASKAQRENLPNLKLASLNYKWLSHFFDNNEASGIIVNFPEPRIKARQAKWRFSHPANLMQIINVLGLNGELWLKTDDSEFFNWSFPFLDEVLEITFLSKDFKESNPALITEYESRWINEGKKSICLRGKVKKLSVDTQITKKSWKEELKK
ncbi:MAG: tRNA (guanosine(46)-N7)-methyltransferase TrmB [Nitrospinae bacterium]|nr:tRNA (guanosine(46)-N7)-methyltransferase TrmB [Nitrospinota bacterium]